LAWAEENLRSFPWRSPGASLYEVFVAEFFLTQTPAENVAEVYPEFLERFPSLGAIRDTPESELVAIIEPLGFHNMRAEALKRIGTEYESLPETSEALQDLPRVGPYVANASLCFALERPLPILDRNVVRVYERAFGDGFPSKEREQVEFAERVLPESGAEARTYNLALLDFGAEVCRKSDPQCDGCFASPSCVYAASESES
jgi:A/G-specific adenine glycosylase